MIDPFADTRPYDRSRRKVPEPIRMRGERPRLQSGLRGCFSLCLAAAIGLLIYFLLPVRTNIVLLGTDSRDPSDPLGRTDTIVLATIVPLRPTVSMLSIPRDLFVEIPEVGQNRINTAFFFSEANQPGSGPAAAKRVVAHNFGVEMDYYVLLQFEGLSAVVDAFGGVQVDIPSPMSGYEAGRHTMNGVQALAFVRDRSGSDDFFRMARGQIFLQSFMRQVMQPASWPRLPAALLALNQVIQTDIPVWLWPRLLLALVRAGPDGIESHILNRNYVIPFTTAGGAQVLDPVWESIDPLVESIFRQRPVRKD